MVNEYPKFLTEEECIRLIALGESGELNPANIKSQGSGYRKAKVRWMKEGELIDKVRKEVSLLSGYPIENQESFHFVKYSQDGEYKPHYDGEKRAKTALIYLNDGFVGGETLFININRTIKPETGKLVIWDNINESGKDPDSFHAGLPVEFGTKYIAVIWIKK